MKRILFFLLLIFCSGCASTTQIFPAASLETLKKGNALIRIDRFNSWGGGARSIRVTDNGKIVGKMAENNHLIWQRPEGEMLIDLVESFGMVVDPTPLKILVKADHQYFFEIFWNETSSFDICNVTHRYSSDSQKSTAIPNTTLFKPPLTGNSTELRLKQLNKLREQNLITSQQYLNKRKAILEEL